MMVPRCKECSGRLKHDDDIFWICEKCGCVHLYTGRQPSDMEVELWDLRGRIALTVKAVTSLLRDVEQDLRTFNRHMREFTASSENEYIECVERIILKYQRIDKLVSDSTQNTKLMIDEFIFEISPLDGGRFEPIDDIFQ